MNDLTTVGRFFDQVFRDFDGYWSSPDFSAPYTATGFPPYNAWLDEDYSLTFEFALAGIPKERVSVTFDGDRMVIDVDEDTEKIEEGRRYLQNKIKNGRSVTKYIVPASKYDTEKAKGSYSNGILTVTIPARESIKPRTLQLN